MDHGKENLYRLTETLHRKGITDIVVSPGSRNAPVIIVLSQSGYFTLHSIADERSAAFYAMGIAQMTGRTTAILCTSGSATLNYAPGVAEAYYQQVPLLVISADRPGAWIDQGEGQTIRQANVFGNFIRRSYNLPGQFACADDRWQFDRLVCEAVDRTQFPARGPVHVNLPVLEPLYAIPETWRKTEVKIIRIPQVENSIAKSDMDELVERWQSAGKKMILVGQLSASEQVQPLLAGLSDDPSVVVLTETTSNVWSDAFIGCIDRTIENITPQDERYRPDILLSFGGAIVSKKIKALLRKMQPAQHWHINPDPDAFHLDTYQSLTHTLPVEALPVLAQLADGYMVKSDYRDLWQQRNMTHRKAHDAYLEKLPFTDFTAFRHVIGTVPENSHIHLANSTPVRYAQLFDYDKRFIFWSNRGTSGIDGSLSTAAGAASCTEDYFTIITGDIAFFYDSNGLWNPRLPKNLRIILINNGGGNIFRIIPGPDKFDEMEPYIETAHQLSVRGIAQTFGVDYRKAANEKELITALKSLYRKQRRAVLLEIVTPAKESAEALKNYFNIFI